MRNKSHTCLLCDYIHICRQLCFCVSVIVGVYVPFGGICVWFVWYLCVHTVVWYAPCVCDSVYMYRLCDICVCAQFVWYLIVHPVCVISVCMYRLRMISMYKYRLCDICVYVSFVWCLFVHSVCVLSVRVCRLCDVCVHVLFVCYLGMLSMYTHRLCDVIVYVQFYDICARVVWYLDVYVPLCCVHRCDFVCMYRLCDICVFGLFVHICVYMPLVWYLCVCTVCAWCRCIRTVFLIAACTYRLCSCTLTQTEKPISRHAWFPSFSISCVYGLVLFCSHVCTWYVALCVLVGPMCF